MLHQEEKVHEVLDQVHNRKNGDSAISIPRFLPPKVFYLLPFKLTHAADFYAWDFLTVRQFIQSYTTDVKNDNILIKE